MDQQARPARISRVRLFALVCLVFIIPMVFAWLLVAEHISFGTQVHRGQRITPPFSISVASITQAKQAALRQALKGKWTILLLSPGQCDQVCKNALAVMARVRAATGLDRSRVQRVVLAFYEIPGTQLGLVEFVKARYPGTRIFTTSGAQVRPILRRQIALKALAPYATQPGTLLLIDPLGNARMSYRPGVRATDVYRDLKRLLKVISA